MNDDQVMVGAPPAPEMQATLANWRTPPFSRWAFHHVREIVPSANIRAGAAAPLESGPTFDLDAVEFEDHAGERRRFDQALALSKTNGIVALHRGRIVAERYAGGFDGDRPHILFSISKSVTGLLAGYLVEEGKLDPERIVLDYLPEVAGSAYADCSVRDVLDMRVSADFVEDYLDTSGGYFRYRVATAWNKPEPDWPGEGLRRFLTTMPRGERDHGEAFHYLSPNSDLLGWLLERVSGETYPELMSRLLWRPLGAEADAYVTVDSFGAPRCAGGICMLPRDLARFGEMMRNQGEAQGRQVAPRGWVEDIRANGDREAWVKGDMLRTFPEGRYRSKWYQTGEPSGAFCGIGIHSQWLYIDPTAEVVIAKASSQDLPINDDLDFMLLKGFAALCREIGGS